MFLLELEHSADQKISKPHANITELNKMSKPWFIDRFTVLFL